VKLKATTSPMEIVPPVIWENLKKLIITNGKMWGIDIAIDDDLTIRESISRFWAAHRIQEDARLAADKDA
jgi:hypothetical protein